MALREDCVYEHTSTSHAQNVCQKTLLQWHCGIWVIRTAFQVSDRLQSSPACPGPCNDFSDSWLVQSAHVSHQISLDNAHRHKPVTQTIHLTLQRGKSTFLTLTPPRSSLFPIAILHRSSFSETHLVCDIATNSYIYRLLHTADCYSFCALTHLSICLVISPQYKARGK